MLIPGIIASSISGSKVVTNDFFSIATVTVGSGGSSSVEFTSIDSTWTHLQIRGLFQTSGGDTEAKLTFNNDTTTTNYATHQIYGNGSSPYATAAANSGYIKTGIANSASGSMFGGFVTDILDYTSTSKAKTVRTLAGADTNGSGYIRLSSGVWFPSTIAAITKITLSPSAGSFNEFSHFALYGVKA